MEGGREGCTRIWWVSPLCRVCYLKWKRLFFWYRFHVLEQQSSSRSCSWWKRTLPSAWQKAIRPLPILIVGEDKGRVKSREVTLSRWSFLATHALCCLPRSRSKNTCVNPFLFLCHLQPTFSPYYRIRTLSSDLSQTISNVSFVDFELRRNKFRYRLRSCTHSPIEPRETRLSALYSPGERGISAILEPFPDEGFIFNSKQNAPHQWNVSAFPHTGPRTSDPCHSRHLCFSICLPFLALNFHRRGWTTFRVLIRKISRSPKHILDHISFTKNLHTHTHTY